nr:hypothetical protein [Acidobacteriota bacterium]
MSVQLPAGIEQRLIRHRLARCAATLRELGEDLRVTVEQVEVLRDAAADDELRAIVSETPSAMAEHRESQHHYVAIAKHLEHLQRSITALEAERDELLERLT